MSSGLLTALELTWSQPERVRPPRSPNLPPKFITQEEEARVCLSIVLFASPGTRPLLLTTSPVHFIYEPLSSASSRMPTPVCGSGTHSIPPFQPVVKDSVSDRGTLG